MKITSRGGARSKQFGRGSTQIIITIVWWTISVCFAFALGVFFSDIVLSNMSTTHPDGVGWGEFDHPSKLAFTDPNLKHTIQELQWKLNMRRARSYSGITVPMHNGYSAKCIPDATMAQMNADYDINKLHRTELGLSDGLLHEDDNVLSVGQVGEYAATNLKFSGEGRPIWTMDIWNNFQEELNKMRDGGPPGYRNSGKSVSSAVAWVLKNELEFCGVPENDPCKLAVFSAISPWAEAIMHWSASKLQRTNIRITSVDFNPCVLKDIPANAIAECLSTLDLVEGSGAVFDLTVSYSGIEHDGLGRYGDPVNPNGDIGAMREMWLLTRSGGMLLLAVQCAVENTQPKTSLSIWGNGKIQVLRHRNYGAERYMQLLVGWEMVGFVVDGRGVIEQRPGETKLSMIFRMIHCSFETKEEQPILLLKKLENMTFDDVVLEGEWSAEKMEQIGREYRSMERGYETTSCSA